jgi:hypothetical protein
MLLPVAVPIAAACSGAGEGRMSTGSISLRVLAEPRDLSMATRGDFQVGIAAANRGAVHVDPELHLARLLVDGKDSLVFSEALLNGFRDARWDDLPPGETVSMSWGSMGEQLFASPGAYTLKLTRGDIESAPVVVRVSP